jgi:hypothetical protein
MHPPAEIIGFPSLTPDCHELELDFDPFPTLQPLARLLSKPTSPSIVHQHSERVSISKFLLTNSARTTYPYVITSTVKTHERYDPQLKLRARISAAMTLFTSVRVLEYHVGFQVAWIQRGTTASIEDVIDQVRHTANASINVRKRYLWDNRRHIFFPTQNPIDQDVALGLFLLALGLLLFAVESALRQPSRAKPLTVRITTPKSLAFLAPVPAGVIPRHSFP